MQANDALRSALPFLRHLEQRPALSAEAWLAEAETFISAHPLGPDALHLLTVLASLYLAGLAHAPQPPVDDGLTAGADDFTRPDNFADFMQAQGLEEE